ncbi:MAG: ATP-binding protein, partial [Bacilli bacterium]|nr:ATP-binding protein [Bacilli bacterium]
MLKIETGLEKRPLKVVIYGAEGIGKSTFASQFPNTLFLDTEGGTSSLPVRRVKCGDSWEYLLSCVEEVIKDPSICQTLVVDTADWAESLCSKYVCEKYRKANIEDFGFGKGYVYLVDEFSK